MGFETNLNNNDSRKFEKYRHLLHNLRTKYRLVKFVNLSISSLGMFGKSCDSFFQMRTNLSINTGHTNYIITKLTGIINLTTYFLELSNKDRLIDIRLSALVFGQWIL